MPDNAEIREARAFTKRVYGSDLAEKATDRFCAAVYRRTDQPMVAGPPVFGLEALPVRPVGGQPLPTIVEFDPPTSLEALGAEKPKDGKRRAHAEAVELADRSQVVLQMRTANYEAMSSVYDRIDSLSTTTVGLAPEFLGWPQIQSLVNQVCWLNRTMRTWAGPEALADVTADSAVTAVDVPRRLVPEVDSDNHLAIGLPGFVKTTKLTGKGVTVAVIDSEIALEHPALKGRVVHRRNYTAEPWRNPGSHGTAVAGLLAADDVVNGGIAPGATIYNYKVFARNRFLHADDFSGALAIQQAVEDGVAVANCSWGAGPIGRKKSREAVAVDAAWALGMVVVKSAGNNGPGASTLTTPAEADGVIVVGGTTLDGTAIADYSSRGPAIKQQRPHLVAPGGDSGAWLMCCLVGGGFGDAGYGTSFAAPQVAGAIALLLEQDPKLSPDQVRDKLCRSAIPLKSVGANDQGHGLLHLP
jgi:serine protease AprX